MPKKITSLNDDTEIPLDAGKSHSSDPFLTAPGINSLDSPNGSVDPMRAIIDGDLDPKCLVPKRRI